jgi:membrane-bound metal-dependent hydrolase YbcI (DUF457 family)
MDTISHGITGALLGKGFFAERHGRLATWALTIGSVFPDCDVFYNAAIRDPLALLKYHRGLTHSYVALPFFAAALAGLTRGFARRRNLPCPSWPALTLIYAVGIASHIFLDVLTSFGTMIWFPLSRHRAAWDWLFIVDFLFTAIALLPQVTAWVYRGREASRRRGLQMWALFSLGTFAVYLLARVIGAPFSLWTAAVASALLAVLFFLPARGGWGFAVPRSAWSRAGCWALLAYLAACGAAHHAALKRVEQFAAGQGQRVDGVAAVPLPPSLLAWSGLVRTADGVYQARFSLRDPRPPEFRFVADGPANRFTAAALELPAVQTYLRFARFPVMRFHEEGDARIVDLLDLRFYGRRDRRPEPFTYRRVFDPSGRLVRQGWLLE